MSETPDRDDESDVVDDSDSTLLYDILVYREWPPNPDSAFDTKASDTLQSLDLGQTSTESWRDRISSWVKWSGQIGKKLFVAFSVCFWKLQSFLFLSKLRFFRTVPNRVSAKNKYVCSL